MDIGEALTSAAKGAAMGAAAGPAGIALGGLSALVLDMAPEVGRWLFGSSAGKAADLIVQAAADATGTADMAAAVQVLSKDPQTAAQLRIQLAQIAAQMQAEADRAAEAQRAAELSVLQAAAADRANAREQTAGLAKLGSGIAWAPAVLSAVIVLSFAGMIYIVLTTPIDQSSLSLANVLLGALAAMATQVANYWLGSSSGSAAKTEQLGTLTAQAQQLVPASVLDRLGYPSGALRPPG